MVDPFVKNIYNNNDICTVTHGTIFRDVSTISKIEPSKKLNYDVNFLKSMRIHKLRVFFSLKVLVMIFY